MEKIKSLSPWEIFDLWETDAGTMDFADMYDRDQLRFRVHMHDAHTGFDHTSTAYMDGAFFFQMPRAEYKDWDKKAVHDPQYAKTGLKAMEAVRGRLDMYAHPIRYVMDELYYDMTASIESANAMEMHKAKAVAACNEPMIFFLCLNIELVQILIFKFYLFLLQIRYFGYGPTNIFKPITFTN